MRCRACDCELSDAEATQFDPTTGEYDDLCFPCSAVPVDTNPILIESDFDTINPEDLDLYHLSIHTHED